ncbi:hypothetical protein [Psychrobacter cryohalolentis]|uniref:Peptidase C51 domain-containing protein n=1 Tax=Psychrobacter cryohalolentis (strain ATCC BAA-1226 / DSM 17306 / VKM B-2378 / K5) TaxID=335284 RepID=Q1Q8S4_PSYCK|nr:hypothetical protein [Psychrobacter cryohalolentis]ABE75929.1 conserved hypothetical protein [Psychrobacter cryohalolentis K5]ASE26110.1 hypothetical protein CEP87_05720 [Psychrobacter cryohalolentis]
MSRLSIWSITTSCSALLLTLGAVGQVHADSMSSLIAQKSSLTDYSARYTPSYPAVPAAKISTRSTIQRAGTSNSYRSNTDNTQPSYSNSSYANKTYSNQNAYVSNNQPNYRYPEVQRQVSSVLPAFLSGNYDNVDSEYLPLLSNAETQSSLAAREVISTARKMALNERTIIQGGCWDYLNAVFKRAGVTRDTIHKGTYGQGPYANSGEIEVGDWLYYINHGYNGVEHSGLFVGWVDEQAKQALILSYAGESRREPARYRVYDLSNVYQIMRPNV